MRIAVAAAFLLCALPALAVPTKTWRITTWADFDAGETDGVLLSSLGEARTGYGTARTDVPVAEVFAAATAPDGAVWLGTGDQAEVWRWDGKAAKKVCKLDGVLVSSLAVGADGTVWAGTVPGAKLYSIKGAGASADCKEVAKLDGADQVWALVADAAKKTVYAATGPNGRLYAVDAATGKNRVLWESGEKHLLSLVRGDGGSLIAGSAEEAILYRVGEDGSARAIHDFAGDEVRAIARVGDALYVAVNEFEHKGATTTAATNKPHGTKIILPSTTIPASGPLPPGRDRKGKGAIFRIDGEGRVEQLHALADGYFSALAADKAGNVFAASGSNGKAYVIRQDASGNGARVEVLTAWNVPERQVLALALDGPHPVFGTGDAGALYAVDFAGPKTARYFTRVLDANAAARWGAARISTAGAVTLETRSGNTSRPDKSWSDWQGLAGSHKTGTAGREGAEGKIASPSGRYLQLRATLGAAARLHDLAVYYLPQNQRARVTEVTVGEDAPSGVARPARTAGKPRSPVVKIRWKVETPPGDDDELVFRVAYREEGDATWKTIGGPDPTTAKELDWNIEAIADGNYLVRVTASDERANSREDTLEHELVSPPYLIDNRRPEVTNLVVAWPTVTGVARDSFSPISELAWSVDGGEWQSVGPRDRVFDELTEEFSFRLPDSLSPASHSIAVRAVDAADNVGLGQATIKARKIGVAMGFIIVQMEVGLGQNLVELLANPATREAAVVDPAFESDRILREAADRGWRITTVLVTHTHPDHVEGVAEVCAATGAVVRVGAGEADIVRRYAPEARVVPAADGEAIPIGALAVTALATPGHTVDGMSYYTGDEIFVGDTLFVGACGRTDFPGGDAPTLHRSLRRIAALPEETRIYPGHDYGATLTTTVGWECQTNPYLRCATEDEFVALRTGKHAPKPTRGPR